MEAKTLKDNEFKWSSIDNLIPYFNGKKDTHERLLEKVFETPVSLSQKFDGTNVGVDQEGQIFGRNKMVDKSEETYMKVDLAVVRAVDVKSILEAFLLETMLEEAQVEKFVVYGELMCNNDLYDYEERGVQNTY